MSGDAAAMRAEVARFDAGDVSGFERFMRRSEAIYRIGFEELGDAPFSSIADMARIAGDLVRLEGHRSVYGLVSKYFRDERLRTVFSFHPLLIGGNPFRASAIYCLIPFLEKTLGRAFRDGRNGKAGRGSRRPDRFARRRDSLRRRRSRRSWSRTARRKASRSRRARSFGRSVVVSNADSAWTYRHLVPTASRRRWTDRKIDRARYSMGLFVWYFGVDRRL